MKLKVCQRTWLLHGARYAERGIRSRLHITVVFPLFHIRYAPLTIKKNVFAASYTKSKNKKKMKKKWRRKKKTPQKQVIEIVVSVVSPLGRTVLPS